MQAINRIQNAMINANAAAAMQGAMVVDSANAHRAYPSFVPCELSPVSKRPGKRPITSKTPTVVVCQRQSVGGLGDGGLLTSGPAGLTWRLDSHHGQMPAELWATYVLNRQMCG